jgi:ubiquinone/menaquinone biosynthesis C-methylase UbiE
MARLLAFAFVAWLPAAAAVLGALVGVRAWVCVPLASAGFALAAALAARRSKVAPRLKEPGRKATDANRWSDLANPDGQYANRWASYADLFEQLTATDWKDAKVAEIGGTNEVLRTMLRGAHYTQLAYPEFDAQDLHQIPDATFDVVVLDQTLEHIPDPEKALREMHRILGENGTAVVSTPFLVPVHEGDGYGDYYRWTPSGLKLVLQRSGFDGDVRSWGNRPAAAALLHDMYLKTTAARDAGLAVEPLDSDPEFPVTVWAVAHKGQGDDQANTGSVESARDSSARGGNGARQFSGSR